MGRQVTSYPSKWSPQRTGEKRKGGDRKIFGDIMAKNLPHPYSLCFCWWPLCHVPFLLTPTPNACWPPYSVHWCPHLPTTSACWPYLQAEYWGPVSSRAGTPCLSEFWPDHFGHFPTLASRSYVRSQNHLQIRLVPREVVYTCSRYTQEKEQNPSTLPALDLLSLSFRIHGKFFLQIVFHL